MGGFLGIGGSSAKTDRNQTLSSYQDLNNLFNFGFGTGKSGIAQGGATTAAGVSDLDSAGGYFSKLASGNRPAMMSAIAPTANAIQSQGDASRRQQVATGTARGGGTAGANQQQKSDQMAQIDNALFAVQPAAAKEQAGIGGQLAQVGAQQTGLGINELNLAAGSAEADLKGSIDSRPDSFKINQQTQQNVTNAIQAGMMMFA